MPEQAAGEKGVVVTFITPDGEAREIRARPGQTLMEAAVENDIPGIEADCGGSCACATCHVVVEDSWFSIVGPPSDMESGTLYFGAFQRPTSRLACQIVIGPVLDGLKVEARKSTSLNSSH